MTEVTRGKTCQVVCLTIDSETEKPKTNVVAGGCRIYVKTPSGETDIVPLTTVSAIAVGVVTFDWSVPLEFAYDNVIAEFVLVDSNDQTGRSFEDIVVVNEIPEAESYEELIRRVTETNDVTGGDWSIDPNTGIQTMRISPGGPVVARFQLYDMFGNITTDPGAAFERRRILT